MTPKASSAVRILLALVPVSAAVAKPQQTATDLTERVRALEAKLQVLEGELASNEFGTTITELGPGTHGFGPAASKVYSVDNGLSIGGYGEFLFEQRSGTTDRLDALRAVLYVGYKFDEHFVFNSEIEFEHATTDASSGTTSSSGEVSVEFAYIGWLYRDAINLRAGLLLMPMGLVNELHEPTTFLTAQRSLTERQILPTTWRENGLGVFGDVGGFAYRAYAVTSLDGDGFDASGLRGGRQNGNRAAANDFAGVLRVDWADTPGLLAGGAVYYGRSGQDRLRGRTAIPALPVTIVELHADYRNGPLWLRGLAAVATVANAGSYNRATGQRLARRLDGWYVEAGYDILAALSPGSEISLTPYLRYEHIDTQASLPSGFAALSSGDDDLLTVGVNFKPIPQIVVKLDFVSRREANDQFHALLGYVF